MATIIKHPEPDTGHVNRLYEAASDLVEAATQLREMPQGRETLRAHPAVLGCVELALHELEQAVAGFRTTAGRASVSGDGVKADLMNRSMENLEIALHDAVTAAAVARPLSARALQRQR